MTVPLTPEREAEIRARLAEVETWWPEINPLDEAAIDLLAEIDRLRAELAAAEARSGWQPIETAPKDNRTGALLSDGRFCYIGLWWYDGWVNGHGQEPSTAPTHWQPLPAPPQGGSDGR